MGIKDSNAYITRHYGKDALDFAYQVFHHDVLASMSLQPFNLISHCRKIWDYDFPRRTYLENRDPIEYEPNKYKNIVQEIDVCLRKG